MQSDEKYWCETELATAKPISKHSDTETAEIKQGMK